jgi:hypothetical protein
MPFTNEPQPTTPLPESPPSHHSPSPTSPPPTPNDRHFSSHSLLVSPHSPIVPSVPTDPAPTHVDPNFSQPRMITHSQTGTLKPRSFPDYQSYLSTKYPFRALTTIQLPAEPTCYSQASLSPAWRVAMGEEFDALLANGTWSLCPRPQHQHAIHNKWVYKIKQKQDGSIDHYKARLVVKGFDQEDGIDFTETFSPVIKPSTIRVILALAVQFNWSIHQLDVSNAFFPGVLLEEVYMEQPHGFIDT